MRRRLISDWTVEQGVFLNLMIILQDACFQAGDPGHVNVSSCDFPLLLLAVTVEDGRHTHKSSRRDIVYV